MTAVQIEDAHRRISSWWEGQKLKAASPATIESRPTDSTVAASGTSEGANRGQSSGAPASADLVQEPIQSSTLGGGSGADAASHAIPTSAAASTAEPAQEDTKITSSQNDPATLPEPAHQAQIAPPLNAADVAGTVDRAKQQPTQQAQDSSRTAPGGSGTTSSSGQEVGQLMPAAGGSPKTGNGKPEPQKTVTQVLPATGQGVTGHGAEAATPTNASNGTVSSPAAGGDVKAPPTNQPLLTNTTANPAAPESTVPPVPVIAEPGPGARAVSPLSTAKPMTVASDVPDSERTSKKPEIQPSPDDYVIGEQDVLTITVWKERELSGSVVVRPDGKITLPLVDDIKVVGLTPAQLRAILTEKLKPYIQVPQVTVAVSQINSRKVYLIGEVIKTGTFSINSSTTVLQILAQAGGVKDFAKRKDIYVLRNEQGKQVRHAFNYDEVIRGKNSEQNILLHPADTIIVP